MANLKLCGVNKIYPSGKTALLNVNLTSPGNEFLVVTGGHDCGKSTLLRVIAGLEEETSGDIYIADKLVNEKDVKERDVAVVFAGNTLNSSLTVAENLAFGLKMRKFPQPVIDQRVKAVAEMLGISDILYRKPKTITSRQRLLTTYGRAIVREPKLYLFDDPLSGLDEKLKDDMRNVLINLQERVSGSFIYATKSISEAMSMGTRIVILNDGFVQQIDTPQNLYDYPANVYVGVFTGSPSMNIIQNVSVVEEDGVVYGMFDGIKMLIPENIVTRWTSLGEYAGTDKTVTFGIRPEDIEMAGGDGSIPGRICSAENMDGKVLAEVDLSKNVSVKVFCEKAEKGAECRIRPDVTHLYVFDSQTGLTLLERDGGYMRDENNIDADFVPLTNNEAENTKRSFTQAAEKEGKETNIKHTDKNAKRK